MFSSVVRCFIQEFVLYSRYCILQEDGVCFPRDVFSLCRQHGALTLNVKVCASVISLNGVFGFTNRYGLDLIWTVLVMAEGTWTGEMPSFDPSPNFEAKKRHISSDGSECPWLRVKVCHLLHYLLSW